MEEGVSILVKRLLKKYTPETVAEMVELSLEKVLEIKSKEQI